MKKLVCLIMFVVMFSTSNAQAVSSCSANWGVESEGLTVFFENYSWSAADAVEHSWNFGDGTTSAEENPTHTFAAEGNYEVCLVINDSNDCTDTDCFTLYVADYGLDDDWADWLDWQD